MNQELLRLLILEDSREDAELAVESLTAEGFTLAVTVVETEVEFRDALADEFDLIIADYSLPAFDGLSAIRLLRASPGPQPPVIVVTGAASEDEAVECMREGADDYLLKDRPARLGQAVRQALARARSNRHGRDVEQGLRASEEQLKVAQRIARLGSWEYRLADRWLTVSDGFRDVFELPEAPIPVDVDGFLQRVHPDDRSRVRDTIQRRAGGLEERETEYRILRQDGSERAILARSEVVIRAGAAVSVRGTAQDITERNEMHRTQQLFEQGFRDAPVGMGLIDLERRAFMRVNDAMCALTGQTRQALESTGWLVRATHPDDQAADDAVYAHLVDGTLKTDKRQKRFVRPDGSVRWVSRHLSPLRDPHGAVTTIFAQVIDITEQKEREQKLKAQVNEVSWIARTRDALDHGRLVLHAQPIVDLATGGILHHELLIRMVDLTEDLVYPGEFLPTAEKYGMITEIDCWVVDQATSIVRAGTPVAMNLSAASIGNLDVLERIERALRLTGANPADLTFEITETALMDNLDRGELFARKLVDMGCRLALDDFGTGFGSFTYLRRLPANFLKIDMAFVTELCRSDRDQHVVKAIVTLAQGFGQLTIAEGVEDEETLRLLRTLGVSHAQGYHIGRPAPLDEMHPTALVVDPRADRAPAGG